VPRPESATASTTTRTDAAVGPADDGSVAPDETSDPDGANPLGGNSPEDQLMPDVVCMNLQDAQDEIQDHGVFFSGSVDATGQGRNQVIDSNWIVVDQSPAPGTPIGEGDAELSVVKSGEPTDC
jgi:PASTA domain-containing protein